MARILGDGRENPRPPKIKHQPKASFDALNLVVGTRIRVIRDNGRSGLRGLEGVVVQSIGGGVVVKLDGDPARRFRVSQAGGFATPSRHPLRFFRVTEVERIQ